MRCKGHAAHTGEKRRVCVCVCVYVYTHTHTHTHIYGVVVGNPAGKRHVKCRCRWEDNIKLNLREMGWEHMDWTDLAVGRYQWQALVSTVRSLRVP